MKKKLFGIFTLIFLLFFSCVSGAFAYVNSKSDMNNVVKKLDQLYDFDCSTFINKGELVGIKLESFNFLTATYKRQVSLTRETIVNSMNKIDIVQNSEDFSDTDKEMQINQLYKDCNSAIADLHNKTMNYLVDLRAELPTITYDRYKVKFANYFNSLQIGIR